MAEPTRFTTAQANFFIGPNTSNVGNAFGDFWFVDSTNGKDGNDGMGPESAFLTLTKAIDKAVAGDTIFVAPGAYDETVAVNKSGLTFVGSGGRGAAYIEPSTAGAEGMQVTVDDVTLVNLGVAGESTASYALNLNACSRFRAYGCKFEGPTGTVVLLNGTATDQVGDALFSDCEFAWGGSGVVFDDSAYGYPTQVFFNNCRFHNLTVACMAEATGGAAVNLEVTDCVFDNDEAGTPPTDYLNFASASSTGIFSGNRFATATNASAVLTIGANQFWCANATEAGWSTARPA